MKLQHLVTQTAVVTDDAAKIAKLKSAGYEVVSEETAEESRHKELSAMNRADLDAHALTLNLKPVEFKLKPEIIDAILESEAADAGNA